MISTTDGPNSSLEEHRKIKNVWSGRIIPCFRPDSVIDPLHESFVNEVERMVTDSLNFESYNL